MEQGERKSPTQTVERSSTEALSYLSLFQPLRPVFCLFQAAIKDCREAAYPLKKETKKSRPEETYVAVCITRGPSLLSSLRPSSSSPESPAQGHVSGSSYSPASVVVEARSPPAVASASSEVCGCEVLPFVLDVEGELKETTGGGAAHGPGVRGTRQKDPREARRSQQVQSEGRRPLEGVEILLRRRPSTGLLARELEVPSFPLPFSLPKTAEKDKKSSASLKTGRRGGQATATTEKQTEDEDEEATSRKDDSQGLGNGRQSLSSRCLNKTTLSRLSKPQKSTKEDVRIPSGPAQRARPTSCPTSEQFGHAPDLAKVKKRTAKRKNPQAIFLPVVLLIDRSLFVCLDSSSLKLARPAYIRKDSPSSLCMRITWARPWYSLRLVVAALPFLLWPNQAGRSAGLRGQPRGGLA